MHCYCLNSGTIDALTVDRLPELARIDRPAFMVTHKVLDNGKTVAMIAWDQHSILRVRWKLLQQRWATSAEVAYRVRYTCQWYDRPAALTLAR